MSLGVRGFNPIWSEVDLQGNLFDDTFWLFVLENTIPYIPADVFHDPDLNTVWNQPIQFLSNGTLPVDIFFVSEQVYRLEFRQHIGPGPATQADPLIYEVNDYVAGQGGSTPVDTIATTSSNQITNPQFALVNFASDSGIATFTFSGAASDLPSPFEVAPGWFIELAGSGNITATQVPLNNSNKNPSNAPWALQLTLSGWTESSVVLYQRFEQNGMLWANKIVSSAITTKVNGPIQSISATLFDSNGNLLATVLEAVDVNQSWNQFKDSGDLKDTTNPNTPPAAYIEYRLALPSNIDIYVTSIQLLVQDLPVEPAFEQDSINRQIDHTYNTAYPIVPVGTVIDYAGFGIPEHYLDCNNQVLNRLVNSLLFHKLTHVETVTLTMGVNTFTVISSVDYRIGMPLEGTGIAAATTIASISGTTITMSAVATATGPSNVRFFATGAGNGTTTFNAPDLRGYVTAGLPGTLFPAGNNGVGARGGEAAHFITRDQMAQHTHDPLVGTGFWMNSSGQGQGVAAPAASAQSANTTGNISGYAGPTALSLVQLTALMRKCIRFE